jgi:indole-3-glycerol phosphate synthase
MNPRSYLSAIVTAHIAAARSDPRDLDDLVNVAQTTTAHHPVGFANSIIKSNQSGHTALIAEIKKKSPKTGQLSTPTLDVATLAATFAQAGATCLSVLTDGPFFGGTGEDLMAVRHATTLPILRKDFTVSAMDVCDAKIIGADCVLLIAGVLPDLELGDLQEVATICGLDTMVEVHTHEELNRALEHNATMIEVNQRNLETFEVDTALACALVADIPQDVIKVAGSGIRTHDDVLRLTDAGFDAVLVGEVLMTATDPKAAVAKLMGANSES